ncbi:heme exporter protein CcmB [Caballeronia sp. KNU42]
MFRLTARIVQRELALTWRRRTAALGCLLFFVIAASLFPLAVGADAALLQAIAPGVLWVTALFAAMLSLARLFGPDFADGALDQMLLSPRSLLTIVMAKIGAHWLTSGFALVLLAPVLALQYGLPFDTVGRLTAALLLGTPVLSLIGSMGAALTLGVRGGGMLLAVLVLPLETPVLIFGANAADPSRAGAWSTANFSLLGASFLAALALCPVATVAALRISAE